MSIPNHNDRREAAEAAKKAMLEKFKTKAQAPADPELAAHLLTNYPSQSELFAFRNSQTATWIVGGRVLTFTTLITGVVELAVVLLVAALIVQRKPA